MSYPDSLYHNITNLWQTAADALHAMCLLPRNGSIDTLCSFSYMTVKGCESVILKTR